MNKIYDKEELQNKFGNPILFSKELNLIFKSGIPVIEKIPKESNWDRISVKKHEKGLIIKNYSTGIIDDDLLKIIFYFQERKYLKKDKSVIGRALIGGSIGTFLGILIGSINPIAGVGIFLTITIIGALTGIGEKKEELPVNAYSEIEFVIRDKKDRIILYCNYNRQNEFLDWVKEYYPTKFIIPKGEEDDKSINIRESRKNKVEEMRKLAELKSSGMLRDEEFEKLKKEILDAE